MSIRRFGPTQGAGVAVIEKQAATLVDPAPLGVTLFVTPLEKGDPTKLISTYSKRDMLRKIGGLISGFDGPECAQDFWDAGNGAGELHFLRVARSTLRKAATELWSREMTNTPGDVTKVKSRPVIRATARSGGRWGSQKRSLHRATTNLNDIGTTTLTTGLTMLLNEWAGGVVALDGVAAKEYTILSNTTAGVVTVSSDVSMSGDLSDASSVDQGYNLLLRTKVGPEGLKRTMALEVGAGEQLPATEFSLSLYVNQEQVRRWPNLSMDPASINYFVRIVNDDPGNYEIDLSDKLAPATPTQADRRPANISGIISSVTATTLTPLLFQFKRTVGVSIPVAALGALTAAMKYQDTYEFEVTVVGGGNATITMKSMRMGGGEVVHTAVVASNANAQAFAFTSPTSPNVPPITITCGTTIFTVGDKFQLDYNPLEDSALVGGLVCPDFINKPNARFRIISNTYAVITVQTGDMTTDGGGAAADRFMVFYPQELGGTDFLDAVVPNGYDGLAAMDDTDYTTVHLNPDVSQCRKLINQNKGLVKVATPDRTATAVVQAGLALAERFNWQFRVELADNITDESSAIDQINTTIGRSDFGVTILPSYGDVMDTERPGQLKRIPLTGMIMGREALMAKTWDGYHKAAAGIDVTLPRVVALPFEPILNEEVLNPQGINVVRQRGAGFIVWGDRTIAVDKNWKWKHQRELMSHYENRLRDGFDYIVFALNDPATQAPLLVTLQAMFLPEFVKHAIRGATFEEAAVIKIDGENNTDATRDDGDLFADISLKLADTVERFIIRVGKAGIFDNVSA